MFCAAPRLTGIVLILFCTSHVFAQDPASFYDTNCAACHSIGGGDQGGPDLKGVTQRRDRQWLIRFVSDPHALIAAGDPTATELVKHWDGMEMPSTPDLSPHFTEALLQYIEQKSAGAGSPTEAAPAVFTPTDVSRGRALFTGAAPLANGGPPCITCHAAADKGGAAGGGRLGRDLTLVSVRLRGPGGVTTWLGAPPTPVMRSIARRAPLTPDETRALTAFFEDLRTRPERPGTFQRAAFAATGAAGALVGLAVFGLMWRGRFREVRKPLVHARVASFRAGGHS